MTADARRALATAILIGVRMAGIVALALDALYTAWFWLILGRNDRRTKKHAELRYFAIITQLSAEVALIIHLAKGLKREAEE